MVCGTRLVARGDCSTVAWYMRAARTWMQATACSTAVAMSLLPCSGTASSCACFSLLSILRFQILRSASPFCHHSHCHWRSPGAPGTMPPKDKAGKKEIQKKQKQVWSA